MEGSRTDSEKKPAHFIVVLLSFPVREHQGGNHPDPLHSAAGGYQPGGPGGSGPEKVSTKIVPENLDLR